MKWILFVIVPTLLNTQQPKGADTGVQLNGAQTMNYVTSFATETECIQAGNNDFALVKNAVPNAFYVCMRGQITTTSKR